MSNPLIEQSFTALENIGDPVAGLTLPVFERLRIDLAQCTL